MREINKLIIRFDMAIQQEIREIITEVMQTKDFYMFSPQDERGNTVEDLLMYWLATTIDVANTRYYVARYIRVPSIEIQCTLQNALVDYESDVFRYFDLPPVFPTEFNIEKIDPSSYLLYAEDTMEYHRSETCRQLSRL